MSASLVGSEMCIRDSRRTSTCRISPKFLTRSSAAPARIRRPSRRRTSTVSYTHLTLPTICSV
eukprot:13545492-Alexandrium_andersonii.AAC.1